MFSCKKFCKPGQILTAKIIIFLQRNSYFHSISASKKQLLSQYLWLNSLIRVNNKPIHYAAWSSQGLQNTGHLMENETRFLSFSELKERYNNKTNFLSFCGDISAIEHLITTVKKNASRKHQL